MDLSHSGSGEHHGSFSEQLQDRPESSDSEANDVDYEPPSEQSDDIEIFDDLEDETDDDDDDDAQNILDNPGDLSNMQIEFTMQEEPNSDSGTYNVEERENSVTQMTYGQLFQLLGADGLQGLLRNVRRMQNDLPSANDDGDDDEFIEPYMPRRRRRARRSGNNFPKVPSDTGRELMRSGLYGSDAYYVDRLKNRKKRLASKLLWRELAIGRRGDRLKDSKAISQDLLPSSIADQIIHYDSRCYSGQFSDDGNFFYSCSQDFKVRMYDTSNPHDWKHYRTVDYPFGQWTITDATLSPDNRLLAYSSIRNIVCLSGTDPSAQSDLTMMNFDLRQVPDLRRFARGPASSHFGIWSIRFSGDGRELVAGTSKNHVIVYDIESQRPILAHQAHTDDVNAVCFGDASSPHILYSGSDDTTIRVWDRRSLGDGRAAGVFVGHTEGLTYVDSKGDGRYVLSNGKDQMMKLWDLRKMMTTADFENIDPGSYSTGFDYRYMTFTEKDYEPHPNDCSIVSFRGHSVHETLIRCHFSPPTSTNSRYVYTGSNNGKVYIYNMDATLAGVLDVGKATTHSRPHDDEDVYDWLTCVRDASWHPNAPIIAATSWNGWGGSTGTCTVHSWNDGISIDEASPQPGLNYDCELKSVPSYDIFANNARRRESHFRRRSLRSRAVRAQAMQFDDGGESDYVL